MLRRTGFAPRQKPMARRKNPLPQVSPTHARQQAAQRKAYAEAADAEQCWCSSCGRAGATDHSHHFTQGLHKQLANDERNWLKLCRTCHRLFEDHKARFAARFPAVWADILAAMEAVDPVRFRAFRLKNPY